MDEKTKRMLDQIEDVPEPGRVIYGWINIFRTLDCLKEKLQDEKLNLNYMLTWQRLKEEINSEIGPKSFDFDIYETFLRISCMGGRFSNIGWTYIFNRNPDGTFDADYLRIEIAGYWTETKGKIEFLKRILCPTPL